MKRYMNKPMLQDLKIRIKILLVFCCLMTFAVNGQKDKNTNSEMNIGFVIIVQDSWYPTDKQKVQVINSNKELSQLINQINSTRKPGIQFPNIDFKQHTVVFVAMGKQVGYEIVDLVLTEETNDKLYLTADLKTANESEFSTTIHYPFSICKIGKTSKKIEVIFK